MKSLTYFTLALLLFMNPMGLSHVFATVAPAPTVDIKRPKIVRTNWVNPMTGFVFANECIDIENSENQLIIQVKVRFALNDISAYPSMYVDVDFGGLYSGISGPITNADLQAVTVDTFDLYEATLLYYMDLDPVCDAESIEFYSNYSLKMLDGSLYPIEDYDGVGDIFDASIFEETNPHRGYPPNYSELKEICCYYGGVNFRSEVQNNQTFAEVKQKKALNNPLFKAETVMLLASPNPFAETLNLKYTGRDLPAKITISNAKGQVLEVLNVLSFTKTNAWSISTADWIPGMYYVRIANEEQSQVIKVVKLAS